MKRKYPEFAESFKKLSGKIEMGIKVFGRTAYKNRNFAGNSLVLKRLEDVGKKSEPVNYLMKKVKSLEEKKMKEQDAKMLYSEVLKSLNELSDDSTVTSGEHELLYINSAFLITKNKLEIFKKRFEDIRRNYPAYIFVCSGPWPPYNFAYVSGTVGKSG
jgi:hypothetical protein